VTHLRTLRVHSSSTAEAGVPYGFLPPEESTQSVGKSVPPRSSGTRKQERFPPRPSFPRTLTL
jgi:hypothetical protein